MTKRIILLVMFIFLYFSNLISGYLCRSPLSNNSLIGVYNFTLFMRVPLMIIYLGSIIFYILEEDEKMNK